MQGIQYVINYDFPVDGVESYVHRIGRTARGESVGTSHTFLTPSEMGNSKVMAELVRLLQRAEQPVPEQLQEAARFGNRNGSNSRSFSRYGDRSGRNGRYGDKRSTGGPFDSYNSRRNDRFGGGRGQERDGYGGGGGGEGGFERSGGRFRSRDDGDVDYSSSFGRSRGRNNSNSYYEDGDSGSKRWRSASHDGSYSRESRRGGAAGALDSEDFAMDEDPDRARAVAMQRAAAAASGGQQQGRVRRDDDSNLDF